MTLYEALFDYQDLYLTRLTDSSRRISDPIATDWQKISNEYDLYFQAVGQGDYATGTTHLDNIILILAGYSLVVDEPVQAPLPLSIYASPPQIDVPVDFLGLTPDYTNSWSWVYIYMGGVDDSANWTYTITVQTNLTANISDHNKVNVTALTADVGSVTLEISKTNYSTLTFMLLVNRRYAAEDGLSINEYPDTIIIPCDSVGTPLSYAQAYSDIIIREGNVDETGNWGLAITGTTDVTANISGGNKVNITNIAADEGSVEVTCTRALYPSQVVNVYVQKQLQGQAVVDSSSVDNVTIELNVSDELQLKDTGITTDKLDTTSIFANFGSLINYRNQDDSQVLVPTIIRRGPGSQNVSVESGHCVGFGNKNIVIGVANIIGPSASATKYDVQDFNPNFNRIFLKTSEGDVSANFVGGDEILVWNTYGDAFTTTGYEDNYRYYIQGEIVSATYTGSQTTIDITPAFTVDDEYITYFTSVVASTDSLKCAHYVALGQPDPRMHNTIIGRNNSINASNTIILGNNWSVKEGTPPVGSYGGNLFIGNGVSGNPLGDANIFIIGPEGNSFGLTHHDDSMLNLGIGTYLAFGSSSDTIGRKGNTNIGLYNIAKSSGSVLIGNDVRSNSDGEFVISAGSQKTRKVFLQLTEITSSTSTATLMLLNDGSVITNSLTDPGHFNMIEDSIFSFTVTLIGVQTASGNVYRRKFTQMASNIGGTTSMVGSLTTVTDYSYSNFGVDPTGYGATADDPNDQLNFFVTPGEALETKWLMMLDGEVVEF